jgi:hypothetical protein
MMRNDLTRAADKNRELFFGSFSTQDALGIHRAGVSMSLKRMIVVVLAEQRVDVVDSKN